MIGENWPIVSELLGLGADNVALWQMALSVVERDGAPRIVEISVEDGVQTMRLELS